jgi:hypothetical protein
MTKMMTKEQQAKIGMSYEGGCFCGAVQIRVTGQPAAMGYCHCESCRQWSAGPVNAFTLWKPESLQVMRGQDQLGSYQKTENSHRKWCRACGGHVFVDHPGWGLVDVFAATIPGFPFQAGVHVNYGERVLRVTDGLPKQKDLPAEMGGTGTALPE